MKQEDALRVLKMGHSAYVAGEPGAGKTHLLNSFTKWARKKGLGCAVTASTGIAATHLGGTTVHSFSGIGIKKQVGEKTLDKMEQDRNLWKRFYKTNILVVDEISMLSAEFLDMLDLVCRTMKRRNIPFGGLQIIFSGDFFQLPPVEDIHYAFQSSSWKKLNPVSCYLTSQYRQRDAKLSQLLMSIRQGKVGNKEKDILNSKIGKSASSEITRLFTHNIDVDALNEEKLNQLPGKGRSFFMTKRGGKGYLESLVKSCLVPEELVLKEGAEVMFVKNDIKHRYVNGTRGTVAGFRTGVPQVKLRSGRVVDANRQSFKREDDGNVLAEVVQVPLRLAWGITVHKSQGMTLDEAEMDLGKSFVTGQGYVALSRVRSLKGLFLTSFNNTALRVDERVIKADQFFRKHSDTAVERLYRLSEKEEKRYRDSFSASCKSDFVL